ncbi:MAG: DUF6314 family protein [Shimia sp.]
MRHADFAGRWRLTRRVESALGVTRGEGRAVIEPGDATRPWTYDEVLTLSLPDGTRLDGRRRYLWHPVPGGFETAFEDGRPFHRLAWTTPTARHLCAPDTYDVAYALDDWPRWRATWRVTGPRKAYVMTTDHAPG